MEIKYEKILLRQTAGWNPPQIHSIDFIDAAPPFNNLNIPLDYT